MRTTWPRSRQAASLGRDQIYVAGLVCGRQRAGPMRRHAGWACRGFAARTRANRRPSADLVSIPFVVDLSDRSSARQCLHRQVWQGETDDASAPGMQRASALSAWRDENFGLTVIVGGPDKRSAPAR
jgi:hypothetical protein